MAHYMPVPAKLVLQKKDSWRGKIK
ncbi:hypothetical protein RDI58_024834 [Solanum bulbocastanum]|uniref:Uncharacterized protein n=1 Tax=Solanum bulbocastanum TaxID=147425 RepID=A0AAN8T6N2_SOLBU